MAAVELTVAALMAMTTNLQASAAAAEKLDFERAAAEAARVIEVTNAPPHVVEAARILRARALLRGGDRESAVRDLQWVRANAVSEGLRQEAAAELRRLEGPPAASTRSVRTPRRTWSILTSSLARGDHAGALQCVQGPLRRLAEALGGMAPAVTGAPSRAVSGLAWAAGEWRGAKMVETVDGDTGTLTLERNGLRMTLSARNAGDAWVFHDLVSLECLDAEPAAAPVPGAAEAAPNAQVAFNFVGGDAMAFRAGGGIVAVNGRVIHLGAGFDGNMQVRVDSATAAAATTNAPPVDETRRAEIEALIRDLGAPAADTRARARAKLKELGPAAHGILKEHRADADVEIATTVRELLGE
ncbi:MAG: hypothetical protein FJ221_09035 [Lentisphaerae bacterium]|nr:hypothetical protein [Lentisphaerota bacterium]